MLMSIILKQKIFKMKTTEEKNRMIAEFMEWKWEVKNHYGINIMRSPEGKGADIKGLKFHTSWDWLMPVVEKIESITGGMLIGRMFCDIEYQDPIIREKHFKIRIASGVKMNAIHEAVCEFIEWYNENK